MTAPTSLDNIFNPGQTPSHTAIFGRTGSGKSVLVSQKLLEELQKQTQQPKD